MGHCSLGKGAAGRGSPAQATPKTLWAPDPFTLVACDEQLGRSPIPGSLPLSKSGNHWVG